MIRLDTVNKSIRIYSDATATTNEPNYATSWDDIRVVNPQFTPGSQDGALNGTTPIAVISAPASSIYRNIKYIHVANVDTVQHVITVELLNNGTQRTLLKVTLGIGEELIFNDGSGWMTLDNIGELKITGNSGANIKVGQIGFGIDNNGSVLTTGTKAYAVVPFSGTIVSWELFSDVAGNVVIDVWKAPYASYPPTVANTITGTDKPTLSSQQKNVDTVLTGWGNQVVNAGDIFAFNIDSVSTITRLNVSLKIIKD